MTVDHAKAESSVFQSYNARALKPSQVARNFVPPKAFEQLAQRRHSLVLGPRGSGKTTLLKMLQPAALESWEHPQADEYCERIDFTGVFVPFDRSWRAQIDALTDSSRDHLLNQAVLGRAAFTTHVFRAVVQAFLSRTNRVESVRPFRRKEISPAQEAELSRLLYTSWTLPDGPKSLLGVRAALGKRLAKIGSLGYQAATGALRELAPEPSELYASFLEGVSVALDAWEGIIEPQEERWALLFDELELAPADIKRELFAALRSRDSRLLFKLALSPFDDEMPFGRGPEDPQPGEDYDVIPLWFSEKRGTIPFCEQLWNSMLTESGRPLVSPRAAFGASRFETARSAWASDASGTAYAAGSRWQRRFSQLEEIDPSFREFLASRGYDSRKLDRLPPAGRAADVRKISPLVEARLFFLRDQSQSKRGSKSRGRKRLTLYAGWETLCAVSEGNPRWFIGMVKQLLDSVEGEGIRISHSQQAKGIEAAAERYRAALRTIPVTSPVARTKREGIMSILDAIGAYFRQHQILSPFSAEPPGSFIADEGLSEDTITVLGQALNAGALVFVDDEEDWALGDIRGRRFRLCYLLVAYHGAMPRLSRAVSLSRILSEMKFNEDRQISLSLP